MRTVFSFFLIFTLTCNVIAQTARVTLTLNLKNATGANGTVVITGDTLITDNSFSSPQTYILKDITGISDEVFDAKKIFIRNNPAANGYSELCFSGYNDLKGKVRIFTLSGNEAGFADIAESSRLMIKTVPGTYILNYTGENEAKSFILINNCHSLTIAFEKLNTEAHNVNDSNLKSGNTNLYSLSYTDPTGNAESYSESFSVTPGNTYTIDQTLDWTSKILSALINTNKNTKVEITNKDNSESLYTETTNTGTLSPSINQRFDNTKGLNLEYILTGTYTDTAKFLFNQFANQTINIDSLRKGWFYYTALGNGENYTLKQGSTLIASASVGTQSFFKLQGDEASITVTVTGTNLQTKTLSETINKGITNETITLDPGAYSHAVTVTALSSITGKTIKDNTELYLVPAASTDTIFAYVTSSTTTFNWSDSNQTETAKIGSKNVPGHTKKETSATIGTNTSTSITFTGLTYSLTQPILLLNQYIEAISGASITGGDATITTGTDGKATLTKSDLTTDINNLTLSSYSLSLSISGSNIQTATATLSSVAGTNTQKTVSAVQQYIQWLSGHVWTDININSVTPIVNVWKGGISVQTATVTDIFGRYETNSVTRTTKTFTPDSITISYDGYFTYLDTVLVMAEGVNYLDVLIQKIHYFYLYGTNSTPEGAEVTGWKNGTEVQTGTVTAKAYKTNSIKAATETFTLDSLTSSKESYVKQKELNVTLNEGGTLKEVNLTPKIIEFYIRLFDINGDKVTDLTQTIEWADGTTSVLTPDSNGTIHVYKEMFTTSETADISNSSIKYSQNFAVFRTTDNNNALVDTNYAQVSKFDDEVNFTRLQLANIPDTLYEYVAKAKVKTPDALTTTYGDSINITHNVVRSMMGGRLGGGTTKFISTPSIPAVDVVQFLFNYNTGATIDQTQIDRAKAELDKVLAVYTLNNGKKLVNTNFHTINSTTDAIWQTIVARGGDNCAYTYFYDQNAYNGCTYTTTDSPNGKARIKNSESIYNTGNTTGVINTEIYQQFTNNMDPSQNTAPWTYNATTSSITDFGKTMARLIYLLNQGTSVGTITEE